MAVLVKRIDNNRSIFIQKKDTAAPNLKLVCTQNTCIVNGNGNEQTCNYYATNNGSQDTNVGIRITFNNPDTPSAITWPAAWGAPIAGPTPNSYDFASLTITVGMITDSFEVTYNNPFCYTHNSGAPSCTIEEIAPSPETNYTDNTGKLARQYLSFAYLAQRFGVYPDIDGVTYLFNSAVLHQESPRYVDNDLNSTNTGNYTNINVQVQNSNSGILLTGTTTNGLGNMATVPVPYGNNCVLHRSLDTAGNDVEVFIWTNLSSQGGTQLRSGYSADEVYLEGDTLSLQYVESTYLDAVPDTAELWINGIQNTSLTSAQILSGFVTQPLLDGDVVEIRWWDSQNLIVPTAPDLVGYCYRKFTIKKYTEF